MALHMASCMPGYDEWKHGNEDSGVSTSYMKWGARNRFLAPHFMPSSVKILWRCAADNTCYIDEWRCATAVEHW